MRKLPAENSPHKRVLVMPAYVAANALRLSTDTFRAAPIPMWCDEYEPYYAYQTIRAVAKQMGIACHAREDVMTPHRKKFYSRSQMEKLFACHYRDIPKAAKALAWQAPSITTQQFEGGKFRHLYWRVNELRTYNIEIFASRMDRIAPVANDYWRTVTTIRPELAALDSVSAENAAMAVLSLHQDIEALRRKAVLAAQRDSSVMATLSKHRVVDWLFEASIAAKNAAPEYTCPFCHADAQQECKTCLGTGYVSKETVGRILDAYVGETETREQVLCQYVRCLSPEYTLGSRSKRGQWVCDRHRARAIGEMSGAPVEVALQGDEKALPYRVISAHYRPNKDCILLQNEDGALLRIYYANGLAMKVTVE